MNRRGFVMLWVIALMFVATLVVAAGLRGTVFRARVVQKQIDSYQRHHEMLGMRDIVWFNLTNSDAEDLEALAQLGARGERQKLSDDITVSYTVSDGQGTVRLTSISELIDPDEQDWLRNVLLRLPNEQWDDLTRRAGPLEISLRAAPDEVLRAVGMDDITLQNALIDARDAFVEDQAELVEFLRDRDIESDEAVDTASMFDFEPDLWRIEIEAFSERRNFSAKYEVLAGLGGEPVIHSWRHIP